MAKNISFLYPLDNYFIVVLINCRFHLVAHDWGGGVAWHFVSKYPEMVKVTISKFLSRIKRFLWNQMGKIVVDPIIDSRNGTDIRFSIRYPAKSGHFSAIRYPAG